IVIQKEERSGRRLKRGESAVYTPTAFDELVRVRDMRLHVSLARRTECRFPAVDAPLVDGQGNEDVRVADHVMIEEIPGVRLKLIGIDSPATDRNRDPDLVLFVAFAFQRQKPEPLVRREVEQGP